MAAAGAHVDATAALIALFDRVAEDYDRIGPPLFAPFAELLVEAATVPRGSRVLDLATGSGAVLLEAAEASGEGAPLVGVDRSIGMLRRAAREVGRRTAAVRLLGMDAAALAFADRRFDRVLCGFALDLCADPAAVLAEARRVLAPGGRLGVTVWAADCPYFLWLASSLDACQTELAIRSHPASAPVKSAAGLRRLLEGCGLTDVRVESIERTVVYPDEQVWWKSLWTHCPRAILERFRPDTLRRLEPCMVQRAEALRRGGGIAAHLSAHLAVGRRPRRERGATEGSTVGD